VIGREFFTAIGVASALVAVALLIYFGPMVFWIVYIAAFGSQ